MLLRGLKLRYKIAEVSIPRRVEELIDGCFKLDNPLGLGGLANEGAVTQVDISYTEVVL